MPELPEVETKVRALALQLPGQELLAVDDLSNGQLVFWKDGRELPHHSTLAGVHRRGKFILLHFDNGWYHAVHLRMTGNLHVADAEAIGRHTRLVWRFSSGRLLLFDDARRFGRVYAGPGLPPNVHKLGPEPFSKELTPRRLHSLLTKRKRRLKSMLLDQTFVAGIGNIYADEILHRCRLHPQTSAQSVGIRKAGQLLEVTRAVLAEAIDRQGTSFDWAYEGGNMQHHLHAYGRKGLPCLTCQATLRSLLVDSRNTVYCPSCQKRRS